MNKATILAIILLAILAAGALLVNRELRDATARPAVQRQLSQARLAQFAEAIRHYQADHRTWPDTTQQLLRAANMPPTSTMVRGAGLYRYRKPAVDAPKDTLVMWSDRPHDGVAAGEPWGGENQVADKAVPAIAYALTAGLEVVALSPEEWAARKPADEKPATVEPPTTTTPPATPPATPPTTPP